MSRNLYSKKLTCVSTPKSVMNNMSGPGPVAFKITWMSRTVVLNCPFIVSNTKAEVLATPINTARKKIAIFHFQSIRFRLHTRICYSKCATAVLPKSLDFILRIIEVQTRGTDSTGKSMNHASED